MKEVYIALVVLLILAIILISLIMKFRKWIKEHLPEWMRGCFGIKDESVVQTEIKQPINSQKNPSWNQQVYDALEDLKISNNKFYDELRQDNAEIRQDNAEIIEGLEKISETNNEIGILNQQGMTKTKFLLDRVKNVRKNMYNFLTGGNN